MEIDFESLCSLIREEARFTEPVEIVPETEFERHLGITGDDAMSLLKAVEERFGVPMSSVQGGYRHLFGLHEGEYLFNGDGLGLLALIPANSHTSVRAFTVGELYDGLLRARDLLAK